MRTHAYTCNKALSLVAMSISSAHGFLIKTSCTSYVDSRIAHAAVGSSGHDRFVTQHQAHQRAERLSEDTRGVWRFTVFPYWEHLGSVESRAQ